MKRSGRGFLVLQPLRGLSPWVVLLALFPLLVCAAEWAPLDKDKVHDPTSPAIDMLQSPAEALQPLPPDSAGNMVRWVTALRDGHIQPQSRLSPRTKVEELDQDILLSLKGGLPAVRFPHRAHTEWLDCKNCHDGLFQRKTGATRISMFRILQGEQCGVCHGAVSFPLTECSRCHSVTREQARAEIEARERAGKTR